MGRNGGPLSAYNCFTELAIWVQVVLGFSTLGTTTAFSQRPEGAVLINELEKWSPGMFDDLNYITEYNIIQDSEMWGCAKNCRRIFYD